MKLILALFFGTVFVLETGAQAGALDLNFSADGAALFDIPGQDNAQAFWDVRSHPDGRILAVGSGGTSTERHGHLVCFRNDGSFDPTFGSGGITNSSPFDNGTGSYNCMAVTPDGSILVGGEANLEAIVAKYLPTGTLDGGFGTDGIARLDASTITALSMQADGSILAAGKNLDPQGDWVVSTFRLLADGQPDVEFSFDGMAEIDFLETGESDSYYVSNILSGQSGVIMVAGQAYYNSGNQLRNTCFALKYDQDGLLDLDFAINGLDTFNYNSSSLCAVSSLQFRQDAGLRLAGYCLASGAETVGFIRELDPIGNLDLGFNATGTWFAPDGCRELITQPDERFLYLGFDSVRRYMPDWTLDNTFGSDGAVALSWGSAHLSPLGIGLQSDHKILLCGVYYDIDQSIYSGVVRFLNDPDIGIPEFSAATNTLIYPNPIADRAEFTFELKAEESMTAEILDAQGKVVRTLFAQRSFPIGSHKIEVDLVDLVAGSYRLILSNGTGRQAIQLVKE